ncbi:MAG TPA: hypothetical protein VGB73_05275 [Pyrinomonadaceae bacterium]|jgi:hypothetical protein
MMIKATKVFTPGAFPEYTYVERSGEHLERDLRDGLDTPGQIVSLAGPSKSGKTVLVEKVVGRDNLIPIQGTSIQNLDQVWERVLDWMDLPAEEAKSKSTSGEASLGASVGYERGKSTIKRRRGLPQVVEEIGNSDFVILLDDFHYMTKTVQAEVAKGLKEGVRLGLKICTAAVLHRADDVLRANPELRGRVRTLDIKYWKKGDLKKIALEGYKKLNVGLNDKTINKFTSEAAGSPQLMQLICLQSCFELGIREELVDYKWLDPTDNQCKLIFERAATATDFRSLVDVLDSGPKTRGTERNTYKFRNGVHGDVYRCVLTAIASDPPQLSFDYDEIVRRTKQICIGDAPVGSSVTGSCLHMSKLAQERFPSERVIDWDEQKQVLDIPNPYLLFYLRWSDRLKES